MPLLSWPSYILRTLRFVQQITYLVSVAVQRNTVYRKGEHLLYKMRKIFKPQHVVMHKYKWLCQEIGFVQTQVFNLVATVHFAVNMGIMYKPVKIGKK